MQAHANFLEIVTARTDTSSILNDASRELTMDSAPMFIIWTRILFMISDMTGEEAMGEGGKSGRREESAASLTQNRLWRHNNLARFHGQNGADLSESCSAVPKLECFPHFGPESARALTHLYISWNDVGCVAIDIYNRLWSESVGEQSDVRSYFLRIT